MSPQFVSVQQLGNWILYTVFVRIFPVQFSPILLNSSLVMGTLMKVASISPLVNLLQNLSNIYFNRLSFQHQKKIPLVLSFGCLPTYFEVTFNPVYTKIFQHLMLLKGFKLRSICSCISIGKYTVSNEYIPFFIGSMGAFLLSAGTKGTEFGFNFIALFPH